MSETSLVAAELRIAALQTDRDDLNKQAEDLREELDKERFQRAAFEGTLQRVERNRMAALDLVETLQAERDRLRGQLDAAHRAARSLRNADADACLRQLDELREENDRLRAAVDAHPTDSSTAEDERRHRALAAARDALHTPLRLPDLGGARPPAPNANDLLRLARWLLGEDTDQ